MYTIYIQVDGNDRGILEGTGSVVDIVPKGTRKPTTKLDM
jgi:hypothetical protein